MSAVFIAIEGLDGSGGTTQTRLLAEWFRAQGHQDVLTTNEPSTGPVGRSIVNDDHRIRRTGLMGERLEGGPQEPLPVIHRYG